jgi:hypothetical protein
MASRCSLGPSGPGLVAGAGTWWAAGIALWPGFSVRVAALYRGWEEPLAKEPKGVVLHQEGRPLLGRKLKGKSQRKLRDFSLLVEDQPTAA